MSSILQHFRYSSLLSNSVYEITDSNGTFIGKHYRKLSLVFDPLSHIDVFRIAIDRLFIIDIGHRCHDIDRRANLYIVGNRNYNQHHSTLSFHMASRMVSRLALSTIMDAFIETIGSFDH